MKIEAAGATHVGQVREGNEDSFLIDESLRCYIVCDGMGGHAAGEIASERSIAFAAHHIRDNKSILEQASASPGGYFRVVELVEKALQYACAELYTLACSDPAYRGMGTTMSLLLIVDGKAVMGHVGDSRLYVVRANTVHQLNTDHTLANELMLDGRLTAEEASASRYNHVLTRVLGAQESVEVETLLFDLFPGDVCLVCSDGLSNYLAEPNQVTTCLNAKGVEQSAESLVAFANAAGGSDNITAIVVQVLGDAIEADEVAKVQHHLAALKSTFLGRGMSESRVMRLLNVASVVRCPAGQNLVSEGNPETGLYIILDGRISVQMRNGSMYEAVKHDYFGHASLAGDGKAHVSAYVMEDAELLYIARNNFQKLTRRVPKLGRLLFKRLADELSQNLYDMLAKSDASLSDTGEWNPDQLR